MFTNKQLKKIIVKKFRQFCKHSTLSGFYYFSENHQWYIYAIWSSIIGASIALCAFLGQMIWQKFVVDPTFIVVESTHYQTEKIPFPAIMVCDAELVYGPSTNNITEILKRRGYKSNQINAFYLSFTAVKQLNYKPEPFLARMHVLLNDLGLTLDAILETLAKPCDVLLVKCTWRSNLHDCATMFRRVHSIAGYCCQFDIEFFKKNAENNTNFVPGMEVTEAFEVIVNATEISPAGVVTKGYVLLYVYDYVQNITLRESYTTLTPSTYFDINVNVWAIDSSKDVKMLSKESRQCLLKSEMLGEVITKTECTARLKLRQVVESCRCLPFQYTSEQLGVEENMRCTWDRLVCVYQALVFSVVQFLLLRLMLVHLDLNLVDKIDRRFNEIAAESSCLPRCDYVQYDTEVEFIQLQSKPSENKAGLSSVAVHFSSHTCMKYRRDVLYTWDQMLANLGGIYGLCLGGSIISIVEVLWFLMDLLYTTCILSFSKKKTPYKKTRVFTLTQNDLMSSSKNGEKNLRRFPFIN